MTFIYHKFSTLKAEIIWVAQDRAVWPWKQKPLFESEHLMYLILLEC